MNAAPSPLAAENTYPVSAAELFRLHAPFVARFLYRLGVRPDAIEDAVQEVFLVVHRQGGYRPGPARPTSYLANLALHAAAAYRRQESTRKGRESDAPIEDVAAPQSDPVRMLEANDSLRRVEEALGRLEPALRTTLILFELEGESCVSIAAAMRVPVGTVYWRVHRARKRFQSALHALGVPRREVAVRAHDFAASPRSGRRERAGMGVFMIGSGPWKKSEACEQLRAQGSRAPLRYAVREGLVRHCELSASSLATPAWAHALGTGGAGLTGSGILMASVVVSAIALVALLVARGSHAGAVIVEPARAVASAPATARSGELKAASLPSEGDSPWLPVPTAVADLPLAAPAPPSSDLAASVPRSKRIPAAAVDRAPAPATPAPAPAPTPSAAGDDLLEMRAVADAERALAVDPALALRMVRSMDARFPSGYLNEERGYVAIMALLAIGNRAEAQPLVSRFLHAYPDSGFTRRVREASRAAHLEQ